MRPVPQRAARPPAPQTQAGQAASAPVAARASAGRWSPPAVGRLRTRSALPHRALRVSAPSRRARQSSWTAGRRSTSGRGRGQSGHPQWRRLSRHLSGGRVPASGSRVAAEMASQLAHHPGGRGYAHAQQLVDDDGGRDVPRSKTPLLKVGAKLVHGPCEASLLGGHLHRHHNDRRPVRVTTREDLDDPPRRTGIREKRIQDENAADERSSTRAMPSGVGTTELVQRCSSSSSGAEVTAAATAAAAAAVAAAATRAPP